MSGCTSGRRSSTRSCGPTRRASTRRRRRRPSSPAATTRRACGRRPTAFVETAAAIATRPRDEWVRLGAEAKIGLQPILSPEEALLDEPLADEGVIVELDDPELGPDPPGRPRLCVRRRREPADPAPSGDGDRRRRRRRRLGSAPRRRCHRRRTRRPAGRRPRARLRPRHRRTVRSPDPRRPRGHRAQDHDARVRSDRRHLRRLQPRQAGPGPRPQGPAGPGDRPPPDRAGRRRPPQHAHRRRRAARHRLRAGRGPSTRRSSTATPAASSATGRGPRCRATTRWATPSPGRRTRRAARITGRRRSGR